MREDRSLDEFFPASDDETDGDGTDDETDDGEAHERGGGVEVEPVDGATAGDASEADVVDTTPATGNASEGKVSADAASTGADGETPVDGAASEHAVGPLRATYRWSPDGEACPACGNVTERQWRDDDRFVCADCKEW